MGVDREVISNGDGVTFPKKNDEVGIEYTGTLYDPNSSDKYKRGKQFDSSSGRGLFRTAIGVGRVIKGWDEGVLEMSLGEKSILTISPDYGYGDRGFPNLIPANSTLIFEVELKSINDKSV